MQDLVKWLKNLEHLASEAYLKGAEAYLNDKTLNTFFLENAEDEAWHYHVMGSAAEFLKSVPDITPAISIDQQTNDRIYKYLDKIKDCVERKSQDRDELIEAIVRLELSEWNDIFYYVLNILKDQTNEFKYPATRFQAHLNTIERFVTNIEKNPQLLESIKKVPAIWIENILIVDDEESITKLIKALLNDSGNIDIAHNGEDALELMDSRFYKLIITDINMPRMDGITFYQEATRRFPSSIGRFLFITGNLTTQTQSYFDENKIPFLEKPMNISALRDEAQNILLSNLDIARVC